MISKINMINNLVPRKYLPVKGFLTITIAKTITFILVIIKN